MLRRLPARSTNAERAGRGREGANPAADRVESRREAEGGHAMPTVESIPRAQRPPSAARIAANRRNAMKSTGPRTPAGKAVSRLNGVTHGLCSKVPVLPGEDAEERRRRLEAWTEDLG